MPDHPPGCPAHPQPESQEAQQPAPPPQDDGGEPQRVELSYRAWNSSLPPRRIKLGIPGWAGEQVPTAEGAKAQPWHCRPFVDAATYGVELVYAFETECRVVRDGDGIIRFNGDFGPEIEEAAARGQRVDIPFGTFAANHYGMTSAMDLMPPPGQVLRVEPHPRFFTDMTGEVPAAVPGHIERFWPRMFFVVFKAPGPGETHVFRKGEPFAQVLAVPAQATYTVSPMAEPVADDRHVQEKQLSALNFLLAKHFWRADNGLWFDDKYKQLLRVFRSQGLDGVRSRLNALAVLARLESARKPTDDSEKDAEG